MENKLVKKLRIDSNQTIRIVNPFPSYLDLIKPLPAGTKISTNIYGKFDQVHLFVKYKSELTTSIKSSKESLNQNGMLWVCYPKQSSKIITDLNRDLVMEMLNELKMRQISLIAIDEVWSAFGLRNEEKLETKRLHKKNEPVKLEYVDKSNRTVKIPEDLELKFKKNKAAMELFDCLSFSNKKEFVLWIVQAKKEETRKERVAKTVQKLIEGKKNPSMK